jgi:uncharacterized protein YciI
MNMHYVVHCLDHDGAVQKRLDNYEAHKSYLAAASVRTVISGPLLADDGETMIGSCFVLEADSKADSRGVQRQRSLRESGACGSRSRSIRSASAWTTADGGAR